MRTQLENEQHYCVAYRTQASELRAQLEESTRAARDLEQERAGLLHQLQLAIARADSEAIARSATLHIHRAMSTLLFVGTFDSKILHISVWKLFVLKLTICDSTVFKFSKSGREKCISIEQHL